MSPLGIQRTIAIILLASPWIFIPGIFKDVVLVVAAVLLFISTLDLRKRTRIQHDTHEERNADPSPAA